MDEKQKLSERAERIVRFRESLTLLPDERFFEIIRIYLGQVQSPYNKTNLIERLSAIFRKEQNQEKIISFLTDFDLKMLSVISMITNATQEKLIDFFSKSYPISEIYAELFSLSERLLIYSWKDKESSEPQIFINPLIEESLSPYFSIEKLLPETICAKRNFETTFSLNPLFLASLISFIRANPEMCKNDLSIRKKERSKLEEIFPVKQEVISLVLNAFINLGILKFGEKGLFFDEEKLLKFSKLPEISQYVYIAVASAVHLGREGLRLQGELFLDVAFSIPDSGFVLQAIMNVAFLLSNRKNFQDESRNQGNFSKILSARRTVDISDDFEDSGNTSQYSGKIIEKIILNAITLGLFSVYGKTETNEEIFIRSEIFTNGTNSVSGDKKGLLNINAGTNITIMPGFSLEELVPLSVFMDILKNSTVSEFEISKKSVSRAFDKNILPEQIFALLEKYNSYEIPQNLKMNLDEWFKTYSSAILYKGYVLKVDEKNARIIERNPKVSPFIQMKLQEGIYLLNVPFEENIQAFIASSGLEFIGNVKTPERKIESLDFPILNQNIKSISIENNEGKTDELKKLSEEGKRTKAELKEKLESLHLSKQQEDVLSSRIEKGVILSEEQLSPFTVRLEILEADGMNYSGKLRLIENAISAGDSVEVFIPADNSGFTMKSYIGKPSSLSKHQEDSFFKLQTEPEGEVKFFSVSMANKIKLIKKSIFN